MPACSKSHWFMWIDANNNSCVAQYCYPVASCIDTPLPKPKTRNHIMLKYAPEWVHVPQDGAHHPEYPECSLESWHKDNGVYIE